MTVRGEPVTIAVKVGHLAITKHMIWLGADVGLGDSVQTAAPPAAVKDKGPAK
jgi:hypothetical protein